MKSFFEEFILYTKENILSNPLYLLVLVLLIPQFLSMKKIYQTFIKHYLIVQLKSGFL